MPAGHCVHVVAMPGAAPSPAVEYEKSGQALQLSAEPREYLPASHGVHIFVPVPVTLDGCEKPPAAAYEPAAHAPPHADDA